MRVYVYCVAYAYECVHMYVVGVGVPLCSHVQNTQELLNELEAHCFSQADNLTLE